VPALYLLVSETDGKHGNPFTLALVHCLQHSSSVAELKFLSQLLASGATGEVRCVWLYDCARGIGTACITKPSTTCVHAFQIADMNVPQTLRAWQAHTGAFAKPDVAQLLRSFNEQVPLCAFPAFACLLPFPPTLTQPDIHVWCVM